MCGWTVWDKISSFTSAQPVRNPKSGRHSGNVSAAPFCTPAESRSPHPVRCAFAPPRRAALRSPSAAPLHPCSRTATSDATMDGRWREERRERQAGLRRRRRPMTPPISNRALLPAVKLSPPLRRAALRSAASRPSEGDFVRRRVPAPSRPAPTERPAFRHTAPPRSVGATLRSHGPSHRHRQCISSQRATTQTQSRAVHCSSHAHDTRPTRAQIDPASRPATACAAEHRRTRLTYAHWHQQRACHHSLPLSCRRWPMPADESTTATAGANAAAATPLPGACLRVLVRDSSAREG